ncbi:AAA family ATPase [Celeribacter neptunius]|uniref:AAA domain-containing protein n=1 Tax=Celeribacter neptunius TaxID=588602 RepID=A0A1I3XUG8_9RHOB|nr:AAA family ATPase [Celeribacter neptunius]SFK23123.1 AAA domain-containing protein [Celeribacter neptunius]
MKVRITGWRAKNLRGYLRDIEIDLSSQPKRWTLLQMPNGTGKTTTMRLFRDALTGATLSSAEVNSLKADDTVEHGMFELSLMIDDEPWRVEMSFDFRTGRCEYSTTSVGIRSGGNKPGRLPTVLRDTLQKGITELFVFDGELAAEIIELGAKRADNSIRALYKLDSFGELERDIDAQVKKRRNNAASISAATTKNSIDRFTRELEEAETTLAHLQRDERKLQSGRIEAEKAIAELESKIGELSSQQEKYSDELAEINQQILQDKSAISELTAHSTELFRSPPLFHDTVRERLDSLGGTMQKLKLPRTMSEEFFLQLADDANHSCICGRELGPVERETIRKNAKEFLGHDQIAVVNQMKLALRDSGQSGETLGNALEQLRTARDRLQMAEQRKLRIEDELEEAGLTEIGEFKDEKSKISFRLESLLEALDKLAGDHFDFSDIAWKSNIPACKREVKARQRKRDTAAGTYEFIQKTEALKALVKSVESNAITRLRRRIKSSTNKNLEDILANEQLRVASIDGSLRLTTDDLELKTSVSEGQKLAVSYAFLTALLAEAPHRFPFIVDSPAVSLDVEIRRTVGELIPPLFEQMIIFVISSEREGFAETFFSRGDENVEFITISIDPVTGRPAQKKGQKDFRSFHTNLGGSV